MKKRLVTVLGTRPEVIRMSRLIPELDVAFDHTLVHTGQNAQLQMRDVFFEELGIRKPDYSFEVDNSSTAAILSSVFMQFEKVLDAISPHAVLALGDTNSALSLVLAKRAGVLTYHLEAGNRSFDERVPEEVNRRLIDHTSDFNLCYTETARANLLAEGLSPRFIGVSGSPIPEVAAYAIAKSSPVETLQRFNVTPREYVVVSLHRQETIDNPVNFSTALEAINHVVNEKKLIALVSGHPRFVDRLARSGITLMDNVRVESPFGYYDYLALQTNAACVLSDSGTLSEEASFLKFPAVSLRNSTERPEGLEHSLFTLSGLAKQDLVSAMELAISRVDAELSIPRGYDEQNFSTRVANFIASTIHVGYVWRGLGESKP